MEATHGLYYHAAVLLLSGNPDVNPTTPLDYRGASILQPWDIIYSLYFAIGKQQTNQKPSYFHNPHLKASALEWERFSLAN